MRSCVVAGSMSEGRWERIDCSAETQYLVSDAVEWNGTNSMLDLVSRILLVRYMASTSTIRGNNHRNHLPLSLGLSLSLPLHLALPAPALQHPARHNCLHRRCRLRLSVHPPSILLLPLLRLLAPPLMIRKIVSRGLLPDRAQSPPHHRPGSSHACHNALARAIKHLLRARRAANCAAHAGDHAFLLFGVLLFPAVLCCFLSLLVMRLYSFFAIGRLSRPEVVVE